MLELVFNGRSPCTEYYVKIHGYKHSLMSKLFLFFSLYRTAFTDKQKIWLRPSSLNCYRCHLCLLYWTGFDIEVPIDTAAAVAAAAAVRVVVQQHYLLFYC